MRLNFMMALCKDRLNELSPRLNSSLVSLGNVSARRIGAMVHANRVEFLPKAKIVQESHGRGVHLRYSSMQIGDGIASRDVRKTGYGNKANSTPIVERNRCKESNIRRQNS